MVAFNFMSQFEAPILTGTKIHTLRDKSRAKVGDTLQLYTGQRTKTCRLIKKVVCTAVVPVEFIADYDWKLDGKWINPIYLEPFAMNDGFSNADELFTWFLDNKGPQWSGYLIAWGDAPYLVIEPKPTPPPTVTIKDGMSFKKIREMM